MNTDARKSPAPGVFATTHWSVVVQAGEAASPQTSEALAQLCNTYWYPLYVYVRRKGYAAHDAQDLTQEFFARLLARNYLGGVDRRKGKFRSFLLGALEHFLAKEWRRAHAQKRGGHATFSLHLSLKVLVAAPRKCQPVGSPEIVALAHTLRGTRGLRDICRDQGAINKQLESFRSDHCRDMSPTISEQRRRHLQIINYIYPIAFKPEVWTKPVLDVESLRADQEIEEPGSSAKTLPFHPAFHSCHCEIGEGTSGNFDKAVRAIEFEHL